MAQHGGKRTPAHPAAVSGPGALSARTDGGPTKSSLDALSGGGYGESKNLQDIVSGAATTPAPSGPSVGNQALAGAMQGGLGFGQPTQQPGTPVTDGSQYGPGQGPEALQANDPTVVEAQQLAQSGVLPLMINVADSDNATDDYKAYVRQVIAALAT